MSVTIHHLLLLFQLAYSVGTQNCSTYQRSSTADYSNQSNSTESLMAANDGGRPDIVNNFPDIANTVTKYPEFIFSLDKATFTLYLGYGLMSLGVLSIIISFFICFCRSYCCHQSRNDPKKTKRHKKKKSIRKSSFYSMDPNVYEDMSDTESKGPRKPSRADRKQSRNEVYEFNEIREKSKNNRDSSVKQVYEMIKDVSNSNAQTISSTIIMMDNYDHASYNKKKCTANSSSSSPPPQLISDQRQTGVNTAYDVANYNEDGILMNEYDISGTLKEKKPKDTNYDALAAGVEDSRIYKDVNVTPSKIQHTDILTPIYSCVNKVRSDINITTNARPTSRTPDPEVCSRKSKQRTPTAAPRSKKSYNWTAINETSEVIYTNNTTNMGDETNIDPEQSQEGKSTPTSPNISVRDTQEYDMSSLNRTSTFKPFAQKPQELSCQTLIQGLKIDMRNVPIQTIESNDIYQNYSPTAL